MSDNANNQPRPTITDPCNIKTEFVDWIASAGHFEGVVNLTFGAANYAIATADQPLAPVVLSHKIRMSLDFAKRLHLALGNIIEDAERGKNATRTPDPDIVV